VTAAHGAAGRGERARGSGCSPASGAQLAGFQRRLQEGDEHTKKNKNVKEDDRWDPPVAVSSVKLASIPSLNKDRKILTSITSL
jgi:hypothetical protein